MEKHIVFDMDGVLFDTERIAARAWRVVGPAYGLTDIDAAIRYCVGRDGRAMQDFLLATYGADFKAVEFALATKQSMQEIIDAEGLPLKPGAADILVHLWKNGWRIGLATSSSRRRAEQNLQVSGLAPYFNAVVTGDMVQRGKPEPDIYLLACRELGTPPESCYAVEDSPNGVRSASAAGLKTILVPDMVEISEEIEKLAFKTFVSLLDVKAYFESLHV